MSFQIRNAKDWLKIGLKKQQDKKQEIVQLIRQQHKKLQQGMGLQQSNSKSGGNGSGMEVQEGLAQFEKRFVVSPHHLDNEAQTLFLLHERLSDQKFILRIISTNDQEDAHKLQASICRKLANQPNNQLIIIDHYIMRQQKTYCNELFRCYLVFKIGERCSLTQWLTIHKANNLIIEEQTVQRALKPLIQAVAWLKFYGHPHPNITMNSIYVNKENNEFSLEDPWMMVGEQDVQYPSPEKLAKMNNEPDQAFDSYLDDIFSLGIIGLILVGIDTDYIYRKGNKIDMDRLRDCLGRVRNHDLRILLERMLGNTEMRQKLLNQATHKEPRQKIKRLVPRKAAQKFSQIRTGFHEDRNLSSVSSRSVGNIRSMQPQQSQDPKPYLPIPFGNQIIESTTTILKQQNIAQNDYHLSSFPSSVLQINGKQNNPSQPVSIRNNPNQQPMIDVGGLEKFKPKPYESIPKPIPYLQSSYSSPSLHITSPLASHNYHQTLENHENYKPNNNENSKKTVPTFHKNGAKPIFTIGEPLKQQTVKQQPSSKLILETQKHTFPHQFIQAPSLPQNQSPRSTQLREDHEFKEKIHQELRKLESNVSEVLNKSYSQPSESNRPSQILPSQLFEQKKTQEVETQRQVRKKSLKKLNQERNSPKKVLLEAEKEESQTPLKKQDKKNIEIDLEDQALDFINISSPAPKNTPQNKENIQVEKPGAEQEKEKEEKDWVPALRANSVSNLESLNNLTIPEESDEESLNGSQVKDKGEFLDENFENGGRYQGYVRDGKRNGHGIFYYRDGGYYDGHWKDNQMNGFGKLYYDNHKLAYEGQWYRDEFHGRGKVFNDTPEPLQGEYDYREMQDTELYWIFYEGDLIHDAKVGYGRMMLSNGEYYEGEYKNDIVHGKGTFYRLNGTSVKGVWMDGQLIKQF